MNNLPVRRTDRSVVPISRPVANVNLKPRKHLRRYKSGVVAVVNPEIVPVKTIPQSRIAVKPNSGSFEPVIQLRPRSLVVKQEVQEIKPLDDHQEAIWDNMLQHPEIAGWFDEWVNNNKELIKQEAIDAVESFMGDVYKRASNIDQAIEEFIDDLEEGTWDNRWDHQNNIYVKKYGDWRKYRMLEIAILSEGRDYDDIDAFDTSFTDGHDPFEGQVFLQNTGTLATNGGMLTHNQKNFEMFELHTPSSPYDILDYGRREKDADSDYTFLASLRRENIPFLGCQVGTQNTSDSFILVPKEEEARVQKLYDSAKRKAKHVFK